MKNTTITLDSQTLDIGRKQAEILGFSFSAWINRLIGLAARRSSQKSMQELMGLAERCAGNSGGKRWTKDEIYER